MNRFAIFRTRRVHQAVERLSRYGFSPALLEDLGSFLAQAADHELYQINPRYWADRLSWDERTMLAVVIAGTAERLFDLSWQTICPICKYYSRAAESLDGVTQLHFCEQCDHDFDAYLDDGIVITVSLRETVRALSPNRRLDPVFREMVNARFGRVPALALLNVPAFHELLSDQILADGRSLGVKELTVFFSDLRNSTALYQNHGDRQAYQWMREHHRVVCATAARHNGRMVKSMGDAMLGVFAQPRDALAAIADAATGLAELNTRIGLIGRDALQLKFGLHTGPCLLVTLNGRLDYLGRTVTIAARLHKLAEGNEVVTSQVVLDDIQASALAVRLGRIDPVGAKPLGLPDSLALHRLTLQATQFRDRK